MKLYTTPTEANSCFKVSAINDIRYCQQVRVDSRGGSPQWGARRKEYLARPFTWSSIINGARALGKGPQTGENSYFASFSVDLGHPEWVNVQSSSLSLRISPSVN